MTAKLEMASKGVSYRGVRGDMFAHLERRRASSANKLVPIETWNQEGEEEYTCYSPEFQHRGGAVEPCSMDDEMWVDPQGQWLRQVILPRGAQVQTGWGKGWKVRGCLTTPEGVHVKGALNGKGAPIVVSGASRRTGVRFESQQKAKVGPTLAE